MLNFIIILIGKSYLKTIPLKQWANKSATLIDKDNQTLRVTWKKNIYKYCIKILPKNIIKRLHKQCSLQNIYKNENTK
jgi:hypothetical protein